jgi:hypothetical protein
MKKVTELEMIKLSSETWYPIICTKDRFTEILKLAKKEELSIPTPILLRQLKKGYSGKILGVLLDDPEGFLEYLISPLIQNAPIEAIR